VSVEDVLNTYLEEIGRYALLNAKEERELAVRMRQGDIEARNQLIRCNLRLVVHTAKKYANQGVSIMDLIEEGNLGLLKAVDHFDETRGNRFSTYGTWWIKQAIRRCLSDSARTIRVPAYMVELVAKWKSVKQELTNAHGVEPSPEEIAEKLNIKGKKEKLSMIKRIVRASSGTTSLNDDDHDTLTDILRDDKVLTAEEISINREEITRVDKLLDQIDEREASILRLRYGLDDGTPMTLDEVGERLSFTRERVRQLESSGLEKLHRLLMGRMT
jgi:RNA polymerase primary sigma factor